MTSPISFIQTNVLKAIIVPYRDKKLRFPLIPFVIPINPESYNEGLKLNLDKRTAAGSQHAAIGYSSSNPQTLKFDFFLDGSNTVDGYFNPLKLPVLGQIENLKLTVYNINGEIHRPNFLKVFWGSLVFSGVLDSLDISYTLFNPLGIPIRAKVAMSLTQHEDRELSLLNSALKSPDVSHVRELKAGQRLDQITNEIYNDPNLVLQVAKANNLTSYRNVNSGTEITLPPIDKQNA